MRQADLVAPFLMHRVAIGHALQVSTQSDVRASDWPSLASDADVRVWLSAGSEPLADYLRGHGLDVTVTGWGLAPWIESAEELAAAIQSAVALSSTAH